MNYKGTDIKYVRGAKISIGLDPSYTRTGIAVSINNKPVIVESISFDKSDKKWQKRYAVKKRLNELASQFRPQVIIIERVRRMSSGFSSINAIQSGYELQTSILDIAGTHNIPAYSVDTRSWKSAIVGTSKPGADGNKKGPTLDFVRSLGLDVDDDAADACCISLYAFLPKSRRKLKKES